MQFINVLHVLHSVYEVTLWLIYIKKIMLTQIFEISIINSKCILTCNDDNGHIHTGS